MKKIEVGQKRIDVRADPLHVRVTYQLIVEDGKTLGEPWLVLVPNPVLEALHAELCQAAGAEVRDLTDEQRIALAGVLYPPLLVCVFTPNTPAQLEEHRQVDAFISAKGAIGRGISVAIPKDRPRLS